MAIIKWREVVPWLPSASPFKGLSQRKRGLGMQIRVRQGSMAHRKHNIFAVCQVHQGGMRRRCVCKYGDAGLPYVIDIQEEQMDYKIIIDSCGDLPEGMKEDGHFESVPLEIFVDDYHIVDDTSFDQAEFLRRVKESPNCPKSACPSPERYMETFRCRAEHIYVVTLSSQLSGSYNSAELGRKLYLEEQAGGKAAKIHVFDSKSASVGETVLAMKIQEYEEAGLEFEEVIARVEAFQKEMNTSFVLETLETLRKNGRLSNLKAFVANTLNIKPVMAGTREGMICQIGQARGIARAVDKMVADLVAKTKGPKEKILAVAHCNCPGRAAEIVEKARKLAEFKKIFVVETAGISSMYASDGGVIVVA